MEAVAEHMKVPNDDTNVETIGALGRCLDAERRRQATTRTQGDTGFRMIIRAVLVLRKGCIRKGQEWTFLKEEAL
jgi:hypothetical protein